MIESSSSPPDGGGWNDGFFPSDLNPCSPQYPVLKVLARPPRGRRLSARRRSRKKVIYSPSPPPSRVFSGKSGIFFGRAGRVAASEGGFAWWEGVSSLGCDLGELACLGVDYESRNLNEVGDQRMMSDSVDGRPYAFLPVAEP